ncbi:conserved Plasmodium protein, unknown function [Plasmodium sp. DRC-Itaito]|uniref:Uncharacterized protein n=1 Tax=Plasmodium gaboni TaxID=647221 RepID=A0ABY1UVV9_9APIC|nr:conserved Plasmodium protein, unknown function [Plasmodium gaboni]SOV24523.1 conserved Plasmodium protein, unknown function [Plasmodium sp. DRC-Itaito]
MSFKEKLNKRKKSNEVIFEGYGKIHQEFKIEDKPRGSKQENLSKKLPFFLNKKKKTTDYDFMVNVSEEDKDVKNVSRTIKLYLNINNDIRLRLSLLYISEQYELFRSYLIALKDMMKSIIVIKVTRKGNIKKKRLSFNSYNMSIIGNWSKKILLYDEITQINIGSCCTPELKIYENKFQDYNNRENYVVIRTLYRDYSFLFLTDYDIFMKLKNSSVLEKLKFILNNKNNPALLNDKDMNNNTDNQRKDKLKIRSRTNNFIDFKRRTVYEQYLNHKDDNNTNEDIDTYDTSRGFKSFFFKVLRSIKTITIDMESEYVKAIMKPNNIIYFNKYNTLNHKINSFFLYCQIQLDICGPEIWFTSKFDDILFTHKS